MAKWEEHLHNRAVAFGDERTSVGQTAHERKSKAVLAVRAAVDMAVAVVSDDDLKFVAQLADAHLARAISETVPLAVTLREEISRIRDWARDRTRPASRAVSP